MKKQRKKTFTFPTEANMDGEIGVTTGLDANRPFKAEDNFSGDSVDKHKEMEAANETIAEDELSQINNNS